MIIKNPYNMIAKHYRLINLIVLLPMVYLLLAYRDIARFYRDFVSNNYRTIETNFADTYVNGLTFAALAFMIVFNIIMYIILLTKKKKGIIYGLGAITYIALIILALLFHGTMMNITGIEATFANFVRDMANIAVLPQYALVLVTFVTGVGFNIKSLRFERKSPLEINEDDEELELRLGSEDKSAKKSLVHLIRELKYYVLENKFVFSILGVVLGIGSLIGLYIHISKTNKVFSLNQIVSAGSLDIALKESYITNVDYRGNEIAKDTYFLAIKIGIKNKGDDSTIDKAVFRIIVNDETIFPTYDRASRFVDVGKPYQGQVLKMAEEDDFVFVYELNPKQVKGTYKLKMLGASKKVDGEVKNTYKTINVKPKNITKVKNLGERNKTKRYNVR